jgi:hypothetical protein
MHVQLSGAPAPCASPGEEDRNTEALVLDQILFLYPETLTFEELVREIGKGSADEAHRDRVDRAVRDLSAAGLLQNAGDLVLPTRAACYFADIGPFF